MYLKAVRSYNRRERWKVEVRGQRLEASAGCALAREYFLLQQAGWLALPGGVDALTS
jgi:hypothetical protein